MGQDPPACQEKSTTVLAWTGVLTVWPSCGEHEQGDHGEGEHDPSPGFAEMGANDDQGDGEQNQGD